MVGVDNAFTFSNILDFYGTATLVNSIKVSLLAGLIGAMMGVLLAYVIVRGKFKARSTLEGISLGGFAFPGPALGIGYLMAFNQPSLMLTGTMMILVICYMFRAFAVDEEAGIIKLQQLSIEVEEASANLGASTATTFRRIVLPIIFPSFMYGLIYVFMRTMITLSAVIFLISPGFPLASIYIFNAATWGDAGLACATTLKLIVVVVACLTILQLSSRWTGLSVTRREV